MAMRPSAVAVLVSIVTVVMAVAPPRAAGQTSTQPPRPAAGALEPQQTSPLPGVTPQAPGAPPAAVPVVPPANIVAPPPPGRVFAAEHGLIFNAIKPDKVADFETVIAKLREALEKSKDPVRNQQGWGWKIYRATEPGPNGSALYVFVMDPTVKGADYGVAKILAEAYPAEIMELYRMYSGAFATAGQTLLNLGPVPTPLAAPGAATTPATTTPGTTTPATTAPATAAPTTTAPATGSPAPTTAPR